MFKSKPKFDLSKLKTALKMAQIRTRLQKQKKQNANSNARRLIAQELQNQKEESARIKTELLIKDEYAVEAYEIIELILEETSNKVNLIGASKTVPDELDQLLSTIVYAAPRIPVNTTHYRLFPLTHSIHTTHAFFSKQLFR